MQIQDSCVLLTGATGNLGQAIARELSGRGARLILTDTDSRAEVLESMAEELDGRALVVDLSQAEGAERLASASEATEADVLVANAALPGSGRLETLSEEELASAFDANLRAPIVLAHALSPGMVKRGVGHLVFVSPVAGKVDTAQTSLYNATDSALRGFALALRAELHPSGVGVSLVSPGLVMEHELLANSATRREVRLRAPEDAARSVAMAIEGDRAEVTVAPLVKRPRS